MQVGSLVECINDNFFSKEEGIEYPSNGIIYTIRGFKDDDAILLEEIINPPRLYSDGFLEKCFYAYRFREVQSPMDLTFIAELQNQIA